MYIVMRAYAYNVPDVVDRAVKTSIIYQSMFKTNHVMWTMGKDNAYVSAGLWSKNMDKLIEIVNRNA